MSKVTPKEFKVGEPIHRHEIEESFSSFKTSEGSFLKGENVRESGLNDSFVGSFVNSTNYFNVATTSVDFPVDVLSTDDRCRPVFHPSTDPRDGYVRHVHPSCFLDVNIPTENHYAIVRTSLRFAMEDYGSRTFFSGRPPVIGGALYYASFDYATPGVSVKDSVSTIGSVDATWRECIGTRQVFGRAFSGKIPAASMLEPHVWEDGLVGSYTLGSLRPVTRERDDRFPGDPGDTDNRDQDNRNKVTVDYEYASSTDFSNQYDYRQSNQMVFDYDFPYSSVHRHTYGTTPGGYAGNIRFVFLASAFVPNIGFEEGFLSFSSRGYESRGCKTVDYPGFRIRDMTMTANIFAL
jgi:hypothetical protein